MQNQLGYKGAFVSITVSESDGHSVLGKAMHIALGAD